jgi:hypothetical protein
LVGAVGLSRWAGGVEFGIVVGVGGCWERVCSCVHDLGIFGVGAGIGVGVDLGCVQAVVYCVCFWVCVLCVVLGVWAGWSTPKCLKKYIVW